MAGQTREVIDTGMEAGSLTWDGTGVHSLGEAIEYVGSEGLARLVETPAEEVLSKVVDMVERAEGKARASAVDSLLFNLLMEAGAVGVRLGYGLALRPALASWGDWLGGAIEAADLRDYDLMAELAEELAGIGGEVPPKG